MATLDDALTQAIELRTELNGVEDVPTLAPGIRINLSIARASLDEVIDHIEDAIRIDNELHPEDR